MVVVIDLEEEEAKKAAAATAAAKQTTESASSNDSNSKEQPQETKSGNGIKDKKCEPAESDSVKDQSGLDGGAEPGASIPNDKMKAEDTSGLTKLKLESSKAAPETVKSQIADKETKPKGQSSKTSESEDKFKDQLSKAPSTEAAGGRKNGEGQVSSVSCNNGSVKNKNNDATPNRPSASKKKDSMEEEKKDVPAAKGSKLSESKKEGASCSLETTSGSENKKEGEKKKTQESFNVSVEAKKEQKNEGATQKKTESQSAAIGGRKDKTIYSSFSSSLKAPNLQSWVKNVRDQLKKNKIDDDVYGRFSNCKTDEERITLLYNLPLVHDILEVKECYKGKNEEAAKNLRVHGNAAFQKKEYDAALKHYSECILKAPSSGSSELALALANRSAVLYHRQQYVLCLQDIKQAFKHKYPDHLQYKLYERRGKACYWLRLKEDANCAFQDAINVLDKAQLDEMKLATVKTDLTKQLQKCSKLVPVESVKTAQDFNHNHCPIPVIKDSRSTHIPCMGNSLVMKNSDNSGRGLYATRNIEVGEVMIIEKPYASVTLPDHNLTHCHHCCNRVVCPLPCHQCSGVVFCSEECQQTAWQTYHFAECKYHDLIQQAELGMGHLALRMVLKAGYEYLREYRKRYDSKPSDPLLLGCNEDGMYDSSDYHSVYNLVAHTKDRSSADLFRRALGSVFMLKCIENSDFFARVEGDDLYDLDEEKMCIGGHILRHTQMLPCNAHEVSEFLFKTYSIQMSEPQEVGSAIYSTLSLINHSCDPSVVRHSYGNECVVRAIRNISKGEEIFDNYGTLYPVMSKPMRQEKLLSQYYFICNCHACACNWPMYEKIRKEFPVLKCKKCKIGRIMIPADNQTTRAICEDCREVTDITPDLLHLSKSEGFYQGCLDKVMKGEEMTEGLPYLVDHLRLIDRLLVRPWKDYNDCQEAIKQCYSTMANCQVLEEPDSDDEELLESERRRRP